MTELCSYHSSEVLPGPSQITWPTKILPATLKVSVGEVPIVICITHEICMDRNTCLLVTVHHCRHEHYTHRPTRTQKAVRYFCFVVFLPSK